MPIPLELFPPPSNLQQTIPSLYFILSFYFVTRLITFLFITYYHVKKFFESTVCRKA